MPARAILGDRCGWVRRARRCAWILASICVLAGVSAPTAFAAGRGLESLERAVDEIAGKLRKADFEGAIAQAEETRPLGRGIPGSPEALQARARLEVLLCNAQIALGDRKAARRSMQRAVYLWPLLSLDEQTSSPRVVEIFVDVRGGAKADR